MTEPGSASIFTGTEGIHSPIWRNFSAGQAGGATPAVVSTIRRLSGQAASSVRMYCRIRSTGQSQTLTLVPPTSVFDAASSRCREVTSAGMHFSVH